ncbi:hypothetical protein BGZ83_002833 [Gryganskiella cystojenkinii]|nr:hypothetical protein BGZ83_002833 [Gryganskiella cystojenkinii]
MSALPQQHSAIISRSQSKRPRGSLDFPIRNLRRYLTMISQQIATGASLIVRHPFIRPPVPTWPLHLHLFVAVVQGTEEIQEHIVDDISDIRFLIDTFFHYLPKLPQMKIVPFQLPIPEGGRGFPGVLKDIEAGEDGKRTLPGQWISDSRVWSRIMSLPMSESAKGSKDPFAAREGENVILYTHGGGYFICSTATHREMLWRISRATGRRIFAPEDPYPAALQDASHAFSHLTDSALGCGFDPKNVTMAGDSAGGGLTIALMMYQRDQGLAMPSKALLLSSRLALQRMRDFLERKEFEEEEEEKITRKQMEEEKMNQQELFEQQQQRQQEKIETMDAQSPILLMNMIREDDDHFFDMETMESGPNSTVFVLA